MLLNAGPRAETFSFNSCSDFSHQLWSFTSHVPLWKLAVPRLLYQITNFSWSACVVLGEGAASGYVEHGRNISCILSFAQVTDNFGVINLNLHLHLP